MLQTLIAAAVSYGIGWIGSATGVITYAAGTGRIVFVLWAVAAFMLLSITFRQRKVQRIHNEIRRSVTEAHRQARA